MYYFYLKFLLFLQNALFAHNSKALQTERQTEMWSQ